MEDLKRMIANDHPSFFLKNSKQPRATYQILWYRYFTQDHPGVDTEFKVDILLPGIMHLPCLRHELIEWVESTQRIASDVTSDTLPLLPLSVVLLQKLQAWDDHKFAEQRHYIVKQHQDAQDIQNMLKLGCVLDLGYTQSWHDFDLFDEEFQLLSQQRVKEFCRCFPSSAETWRILGFETYEYE
jgi:hypothetical protein